MDMNLGKLLEKVMDREVTLMLPKNITDSMDMNLGKLQETVRDRKA